MGHELDYRMGNSGDIIKHGLLAEFVAWWGETYDNRILRVADSFGGCPWGDLEESVKITLEKLSGSVLAKAQINGGKGSKYLGSGHLIQQAGKECSVETSVQVSDKKEAARSALKASGLAMIEPRLPCDDGYGILDSVYSQKYDLKFLDPYGKFLLEESNTGNKQFARIRNEVSSNSYIFIAVFVLDMNSNNRVGQNFAKFKESNLSGWAFSIRCPKPSGCKYDSEIMLISRQIKEGKCTQLFERLQRFVVQAEHALNTSLKLWGA